MVQGVEGSSVPIDKVTMVRNCYLIASPNDIVAPLLPFIEGENPFNTLAADAVKNLNSVIITAILPFRFANGAVNQRRFDAIFAAERIRCLPLIAPEKDDNSEVDNEKARQIAMERFREEAGTEEFVNWVRDSTVFELHASLLVEDGREAARELLLQAVVGTWTAFEVFISGFIIELLNKNPAACVMLFASEKAKKHIGGKEGIPLEALASRGFDLSTSMGSLLFANRKLDNLAIVRDIVQSILPEEREAQIALNSDNLWELNQRRHLIVHQRGLVDDTYLKRTADKASMGDRLEVTSHQLEKYILTVREVIQQLLKSVVRQSP